MAKSSETPDLGKAHGRTPDRGRPSGHTPVDHADPTRKLTSAEQDPPGDGEPKPTEKARPKDTHRGGA
ncbi:MAG: hypothetical protein WDN69_25250 [Aliidongia sp.]